MFLYKINTTVLNLQISGMLPVLSGFLNHFLIQSRGTNLGNNYTVLQQIKNKGK